MYVYSCQMGFGSECSLGGTQLPASGGQQLGARYAIRACCVRAGLPPTAHASDFLARGVSVHACHGRAPTDQVRLAWARDPSGWVWAFAQFSTWA